MNRKLSPKDFEKLSEAVTKAIASAPQVRRILRRIQKNPEIDLNRCLAILLRVQSKQETKKAKPGTPRTTRKRQTRSQKQKSAIQFIDGRRLSANEVGFLEFCSERFDSEAWLRTLGLRLDDD